MIDDDAYIYEYAPRGFQIAWSENYRLVSEGDPGWPQALEELEEKLAEQAELVKRANARLLADAVYGQAVEVKAGHVACFVAERLCPLPLACLTRQLLSIPSILCRRGGSSSSWGSL